MEVPFWASGSWNTELNHTLGSIHFFKNKLCGTTRDVLGGPPGLQLPLQKNPRPPIASVLRPSEPEWFFHVPSDVSQSYCTLS